MYRHMYQLLSSLLFSSWEFFWLFLVISRVLLVDICLSFLHYHLWTFVFYFVDSSLMSLLLSYSYFHKIRAQDLQRSSLDLEELPAWRVDNCTTLTLTDRDTFQNSAHRALQSDWCTTLQSTGGNDGMWSPSLSSSSSSSHVLCVKRDSGSVSQYPIVDNFMATTSIIITVIPCRYMHISIW